MQASIMDNFELFWELFNPDPEFANRRTATQRLWVQCRPDRQRAIIEWLQSGKKTKRYDFLHKFPPEKEHIVQY